MLQIIRDNLSGPFTWIVIGIIVVPFAFFGIQTFKNGSGDPVVAKVGDQKITQAQLKAGYEQRLRQMQQLMGENFRADQFDTPAFRSAVLKDMVEESRMRQYVEGARYRAADAAVFEEIKSIPAFQDKGQFSSDAYRNALSARGYTPQRFEDSLRDSIVMEQLREGIVGSDFVADAQAQRDWQLAKQQRTLVYASFDPKKYESRVEVTPAQIQARYQEQKARYQAPERIKLAYVQLSQAALPPAPAPSADVLKAMYETEKTARFSTPEERLTRHILVRFGADKQKAREKLEGLAQKIKGGADFGTVAEAESDDTGSKKQGGSLGWIKRGQMLEKFEQAAFALKKGETSAPVETEFGWHLIQVEDIHEARTKPFESAEVQAQLLDLYRGKESQKRFQEMQEKLEQLAFESPTSLDGVTKELGLKVQASDWITRAGGTGLAAERGVLDAAFSDDVLKNGENSKPIALADGSVVVVRKQEYQPPRQMELKEVSDTIAGELKTEGARARAHADAEAVLAAAKAGRSLDTAAREKGAEVHPSASITRDKTEVDAQIRDALFHLPRPKGAPSFTQVNLQSGAIAVLALTDVQDAPWPPADAADAGRERGRLRDAVAGSEFAAYRSYVAEKMPGDIKEQPAETTPEPVPEPAPEPAN